MKLFTMALRNIKLNLKKYIMYFFSMCFSVFTVYTFLALMDNEYVQLAFTHDVRYTSLLSSFGVIIMVFVLFFLVSSNNSFIKARKKELSTYSLFGMTNGMIGRLLFLETMLVGIAALSIGIAVGIFFSKLMAMLLLKLTLTGFVGDVAFSIGLKPIMITDVVFISVFCIMGMSGFLVVSRFALVDLFKAEKMTEGKSEGSIPALLASLLLIGGGYYLACVRESMVVVLAAIPILIMVIAGTYLFFWGGLPKILSIIKRNKKAYYRGENLISTSAFSHRMKSIASVMATIAVLSAVATTAIATGFTLYSNVENNAYGVTGYDLYFFGGGEGLRNEVYQVFEKYNTRVTEEYTTELYEATPRMDTIYVNNHEHFTPGKDYFRVYPQSEYNRLISISKGNLKPVEIHESEGLYLYPFSPDNIEDAIIGQVLDFGVKSIRLTEINRSGVAGFGASHILVLNDKDFKVLLENGVIRTSDTNGKAYHSATVFNFAPSPKSKSLDTELNNVLEDTGAGYRTAYRLFNESMEIFGLICFIGFFMSAVFILMTASLLYFKQVMAAEEEKHQYAMLRKIGIDDKMEGNIIKRRLLPVFFIPLILGICHSIFAMKTADTLIFSNIIYAGNSYLAVLGFSSVMYGAYGIVYGIFYLITRGQYARIVR